MSNTVKHMILALIPGMMILSLEAAGRQKDASAAQIAPQVQVVRGTTTNVRKQSLAKDDKLPEDPKKRYLWHVRVIGMGKANVVVLDNYKRIYLEPQKRKFEQYLEAEKQGRNRQAWIDYYTGMIKWIDGQLAVLKSYEEVCRQEMRLPLVAVSRRQQTKAKLEMLKRDLGNKFSIAWNTRPSKPQGR